MVKSVHLISYMKKISFLLLLIFSISAYSQNRLIINNDAFVCIDSSTYLVIDNPNANAISVSGSGGHIISENETASVKWNIDTIIGTYVVPFAKDSAKKIPLTLNLSGAGTGSGSIVFSTYAGSSWDNDIYKPGDVTNMCVLDTGCPANQSQFAIDRFWIIDAQGYSTKPVSDITFTYLDEEWIASGNSISEPDMIAKRFNPDPNYVWNDWNGAVGTTDTSTNTTLSGVVDSADFFRSWTLVSKTISLIVTITQIDVACNGDSSGSVTATVNGGTSPYSYIWSNGDTTQTTSGLSAGVYTVTVTDAASATATANVTITEPAAISDSISVVDISCNGVNDGSIDLTVSGGTTPYGFLWSNNETTEDIIGLSAGYFIVTITDSLGCTAVDSAEIIEPAAIIFAFTTTDISCNGANDGAIDLTVSGGTTPYAFAWSNSDTTENITGLPAGYFIVTVTDSSGCSSIDSVEIIEPLSISLILSATDISCNGAGDGAINLTVSGGTTPYSFVWSNSDTTEDISGLSAGYFTVTVTDSSGCNGIDSAEIIEPAPISLIFAATDISCNSASDGSIDLTVSGGTSPYGFLWSNNETTEDITGLSVGTYSVTVTDSTLCTTIDSISVIQPDSALTVSISSQTNIACFGDSTGSATLSVSGGTGGYTYLWSNGDTTVSIQYLTADTYNVTVTDTNDCTSQLSVTITSPSQLSVLSDIVNVCPGDTNGSVSLSVSGGTPQYTYLWNTGSTDFVITELQAGDYFVTVSDSNSCTVNQSFSVLLLQSPDIVLGNIIGNCSGATVNLDAGEGFAGYTWNTGDTASFIEVYSASVYSVTVTDTSGCSSSDSIQVNFYDNPVVSLGPDTTIDYNVTVTLDAGDDGITYLWSTEETTQTITVTEQGTYSVTVTDINGCINTDEITITVKEPEKPELIIYNTFTPNNDDVNDTWHIENIELYPNSTVEIYNRNGNQVFKSDNYQNKEWDGRYDGKDMPASTYYYLIELSDGEVLKGHVTILR